MRILLGVMAILITNTLAAQEISLAKALWGRVPDSLVHVAPTVSTDGWRSVSCANFVSPDSVALIPRADGGPVYGLWTWQRVHRYGDTWEYRWTPLDLARVSGDTLRAAVVSVSCPSPVGIDLLVERDGLFLGVNGDLMPTVVGLDRSRLLTWHPRNPTVEVIDSSGSVDSAVVQVGESGGPARLMGRHAYMAWAASGERLASAERERRIRARRWTPGITRAVIDHKVKVGMTAEMVELAWGKPASKSKTITASKTREQWVYGNGNYVYLDNGLVSAVQTAD